MRERGYTGRYMNTYMTESRVPAVNLLDDRLTPVKSMSGSGGGAMASLALTMGIMLSLSRADRVERRFSLLDSSLKSGFVNRI